MNEFVMNLSKTLTILIFVVLNGNGKLGMMGVIVVMIVITMTAMVTMIR